MSKFTGMLIRFLKAAMKALAPVIAACTAGAKKIGAYLMKLWGRRDEAKRAASAAVNKARAYWKKQPGARKRTIAIAAGAVCMLLMVSVTVIAIGAEASEIVVDDDGNCVSCNGTGNCSTCGGTSNCKYCGGTGDCKYCYGLGDCDECNNGTRDCGICDFGYCKYCNFGYRYSGGKERVCTICNGTGYHAGCNGTGQLKCNHCEGSGICFACHGDKDCHACEGDGDCGSCKNSGKCRVCKGKGRR